MHWGSGCCVRLSEARAVQMEGGGLFHMSTFNLCPRPKASAPEPLTLAPSAPPPPRLPSLLSLPLTQASDPY